jgi:hypothetical protein
MRDPRPPLRVAALPVTFHVGVHAVTLAPQDRRWGVTIDGAASPSTFMTQAEAWEEGVREADRLDRLAAR